MSKWTVSNKKIMEKMCPVLNTEFFYVFDKGDKFLDDKVLIDDNQIFILLDGVIFNKVEIMEELKKAIWEETVFALYQKEGIEFVKRLRGTFNGIIIDKKNKCLRAFVDQLGERSVFYHTSHINNIISTDFNEIVDCLKTENVKYTEDKEAIKRLLYFGYMVDNRTCILDVKRVFPGNYLYEDKNSMEEIAYFRFDNRKVLEKTDEELIELIDETFVHALKLEMDKDKEYGYAHLMDISGGMDARTMVFSAKKHGYNNITNICYSQMNAYEKDITEKLVRQLGNDYIFKSLDNASFIYAVDDLVKENYGLSYFAGITGGRDLLKILDRGSFGMEHTGILGDVYDGSFNEEPVYELPKVDQKYRFSKLLNIDLNMDFLEEYSDNEIFAFYTRGILAGTSTHLIRQHYFESYSPFEDVDVLKLMFSIPMKKRINDKIYMQWVNKKYPEALKCRYAKTMCNPNCGNVKIKLRVLWNIMLIKFLLPIKKRLNFDSEWNYKGTMNPMEYWYEKNKDIRNFIDGYYNENIGFVVDEEIKKYLETIQNKGNALDKMIMMTVLSIYKQYIYK